MQAESETWPLATRDADTRSPELADRSASGATRPPRKQGAKRSMEFRLACCITFDVRGWPQASPLDGWVSPRRWLPLAHFMLLQNLRNVSLK
jgi:hypothetical protein